MKLLVDANLSPRVVAVLVTAGHEAIHVFDIGLADASDPVILRRAADRIEKAEVLIHVLPSVTHFHRPLEPALNFLRFTPQHRCLIRHADRG